MTAQNVYKRIKIESTEMWTFDLSVWLLNWKTEKEAGMVWIFCFFSMKNAGFFLLLSRILHFIWIKYLIFMVMQEKQRKTHSGTHFHLLIILRGWMSELLLFFQLRNLCKVEQDQYNGLKPFLWCSWSLFNVCFNLFQPEEGTES